MPVVTLADTDRTLVAPWESITITETAPGSSTAHLVIKDTDNSIEVPDLATAVIYDEVNGKNIFQGLMQKPKGTIQAIGRVIDIDLIDLNALLETTLVGVPDGLTWTHDEIADVWTCVDPEAQLKAGSDADNVARLFAAYWKYPIAIDTSTFVEAINPSVGDPPTYFDRTNLRASLDELAAISSDQTYYWIDADAKLHWTNRPQPGAPSGGAGIKGNVLMLFPQIVNPNPPIPPAPYVLSDTPDELTSIGYENFTYDRDASAFAYSLYANGGTGFTYTPAIGPPTTPGHYIATFSGATLIYARHNDGSIGVHAIFGSAGHQEYVNPTFVAFTSSGGGHFYEIKTDTPLVYPAGWLIRASDLKVTFEPVRTDVIPSKIGIGGTGWVNDGAPSWLSRYIDLPDAQTKLQRDNLGGAALAQMNVPVIRGSCDVVWPSVLFRAGSELHVENHPWRLNDPFTLQRVTTTFMSGIDLRRAQLEWGNAPLGSLGLRRQATRRQNQAKGATIHLLTVNKPVLLAGERCLVRAQLGNDAENTWPIAGKLVKWTVVVTDSVGNDVTSSTAYLFEPDTSVTDAKGAASTWFTPDTILGLDYDIIATSPDGADFPEPLMAIIGKTTVRVLKGDPAGAFHGAQVKPPGGAYIADSYSPDLTETVFDTDGYATGGPTLPFLVIPAGLGGFYRVSFCAGFNPDNQPAGDYVAFAAPYSDTYINPCISEIQGPKDRQIFVTGTVTLELPEGEGVWMNMGQYSGSSLVLRAFPTFLEIEYLGPST